ncbi:MAG: peptide-methionine (S)-S-oxide reductase MsrA [Hyphomonadaceae bacterium]
MEPILFTKKPAPLPGPESALPGRLDPIPTSSKNIVFNRELKSPAPAGYQEVWVALGCFWGAERRFWQTEGVWLTAAGYVGGHTPNPTYREVCSGKTGHTEAVRVVFDPEMISLDGILKVFWEAHDPTQGMRQGNDVGTQYRSGIYTTSPEQGARARHSMADYQSALTKAGISHEITTEISPARDFYYAEEEHQQYLEKNPSGYCGLSGTGVTC